MDNKVSVIVPVYNVEKYLIKCLDSIIAQTYDNIEIILIDDGSTDNSGNICDEYGVADDRVVVYHKFNEGVSSARNMGIEKSTGEYIVFIDSDDFVDKDFVKILLENIVSNQCQMSVCSVNRTSNHKIEDKKKENFLIEEKKYLGQLESYKMIMDNQDFSGYCWNKMYSANIIRKMEYYFIETIFEDMEFNCRYLKLCKLICFTNKKLYNYYANYKGITGGFKVNDSILRGVETYSSVYDIYTDVCPDYEQFVAYEKLKFKLNLNFKIHRNKYKTVFNYKDDMCYRIVMGGSKIALSKKIYMAISYKFPIFTSSAKYNVNRILRRK